MKGVWMASAAVFTDLLLRHYDDSAFLFGFSWWLSRAPLRAFGV
jgi:hypothetical protein